jgi:hypothetical protein
VVAGGGVKLLLKTQQTFTVEEGLLIEGLTTADKVYYAAVTPGAVVDQGVLSAAGGRFEYLFDPKAVHQRIPIYDIENHRNGQPQIGRIIHLTFFTKENTNGVIGHSFCRVILRGTTAIYSC